MHISNKQSRTSIHKVADGIYPVNTPVTIEGGPGGISISSSSLRSHNVAIDPLGENPNGTPFASKIFDPYQAWAEIGARGNLNASRQSVVRGEALFNNAPGDFGIAGAR